MILVDAIREFWLNIFTSLENGELISTILTIITVFLIPIYALGVLKYFDALLYRISQIFVRPLNLVIYFLDQTSSSVKKLTFKYHVANTVFVMAALAMIITEYAMIQEFLQAQFTDGSAGEGSFDLSALGIENNTESQSSSSQVNFLGTFKFSTSSVLSITYISIATLFGFFTFELNTKFKSVYQGVFEPKVSEETSITGDKKKLFFQFSIFFAIPLVILAIIQGYLGYERETLIISDGSYGTIFLLVATGFLIPIIAGIGLMSLHIFLAQIAMLLKLVLQIIKDLIIALSLKIIALVDFLSALITKTVILFLGVESDLKNALDGERKKIMSKPKDDDFIAKIDRIKAMLKIRFLKRLVPVELDEDGYSIYILDKLDLHSEYANAFWKKKKQNDILSFVCSEPNFRLEKKLNEVYLLKNTFKDIEREIIMKYKLNKHEIRFKIVDTTNSKPVERDIVELSKFKDTSKIKVKDFSKYNVFLVDIKHHKTKIQPEQKKKILENDKNI